MLCFQDDNFIPTMTAEETLWFYSAMALPPGCSKAEHYARVLEVLSVVGLAGHTGTLVSHSAALLIITIPALVLFIGTAPYT